MKPDRFPKQFVVVFAATLALYLAVFHGIEHLRARKGPWAVTFAQVADGSPALVISQRKLKVSEVRLVFPGEKSGAANGPSTVIFRTPRPVPYNVPFGKCVFEDLTFLPGTVTLHLFGHEIELLPRTLIIDKREHPWISNSTISLSITNKLPYLKGRKP